MIAQQRDAWWWYKVNGTLRHGMVRGFTPQRHVVLSEYPKSGGSWMSQMVSTYLEIPYPRNRLPGFQKNFIHGCYLDVSPKNDLIIVWRDGRDTMVSFYYHLMFEKPITSAKFSARLKQQLNITDREKIHENLPRFIQYCFEGGYPGYTWVDFHNRWKDRTGYVQTSYEAMTEDPRRELVKILTHLEPDREHAPADIDRIIDQFSFEKQTNRKRGEEDHTSFIRKGIVGDWKNAFSPEARKVFHGYAGDTLIALGYEQDDSWVNET